MDGIAAAIAFAMHQMIADLPGAVGALDTPAGWRAERCAGFDVHPGTRCEQRRQHRNRSPEQIFGSPQKAKTRAFVNRIRSYTRRLDTADFDVYAMNGEIEAFCEKHILPKDTRENLLLAVEELREIHRPELPGAPVELAAHARVLNPYKD